MNEIAMMEEIRHLTIEADDQLYFENYYANPGIASKFMIEWIISTDFRREVIPFSGLSIPDNIDQKYYREELTELLKDKDEFSVTYNNITYKFNLSPIKIIIGFEKPNHEMVF